jgi:hypothetical protein
MKKIIPEDLEKLKSLREQLIEIVTLIGEAHLTEYLLKKQLEENKLTISNYEKSFDKFRDQEQILFQELQTKYGTSNINLETGEILG